MKLFGNFYPITSYSTHNIVLWAKDWYTLYSYPVISPMVLFTLLTPYTNPLGHSSMTKNGQRLMKSIFSAIFTPITSYSTHNIVSWANGRYLVNL